MSYKLGPAGGVGGSPYDAPYPTVTALGNPFAISAMQGRSGCPPNYVVTGIFGRADGEVDALGVYIAST